MSASGDATGHTPAESELRRVSRRYSGYFLTGGAALLLLGALYLSFTAPAALLVGGAIAGFGFVFVALALIGMRRPRA